MRCALLLVLAAAGCFPAPVPMTSIRHDFRPAGAARCLFVLLPGAGDEAADFEDKGFLAVIRAEGLAADVIASNATLGYYVKGKMPEQLFVDVVAPAQAAGRYEQTWLVGMSMGGLGALMTAQRHGERIAGVIALAPYLGRDEVLGAIRKAGGLAAWTPPPEAPPTSDNYDAQLWRWLKAATEPDARAPELYLGWGKDDGLGGIDRMLAARLPPGHVRITDGGHDWGPWRRLLGEFLHFGTAGKSCAPR